MIDFGFSKRYIDPHTRRHIPDSKAKRDFIGNYWFSSVNVHCRGTVPSRRDDLEAAALMFIHLLTPRGLPWTRNGIPKTDAIHTQLKHQKRRARPEGLCRGLPGEFEEFLRYCRSLKFAEQPDYSRWIEEFRQLKVEEGYGDSAEFMWPPPKPQKSAEVTPRRMRTPGVVAPDAMEGILNDLTKLNLNQAGERQVLGDRKNVEEAVRQAHADSAATKVTIEISSGSEGGPEDVNLVPKAKRLARLTAKASTATDNSALSSLVLEFVEVMKCNSSRTLTKDGFAFLDALYKQLADPSVFVTPMRTSRQGSHIQQIEEKDPPHVKLGVVSRLKREVREARSNKDMAAMVEDFGRVTNKSTGRTITKDGFGFFEGLAERLTVLQ
ncbi:kinase-like domain-containing protein [Lyophyllum atratum]|nr:kinase-like domain-containing protein [Lyophyllum atratum]